MMQILGLALSLPSAIIGSIAILMELVERGYLPMGWAITTFCLIIGNILFLMVYYAYKRKD